MSKKKKINIIHHFKKKQKTKYQSPFKLTFYYIHPKNQSNNNYYTNTIILNHTLVNLFFNNLQSKNKNTKF